MLRIALSSIITLALTISISLAIDETAPIIIAMLIGSGFAAGGFVAIAAAATADEVN
jgi:xanthine/uracil permease